MLDSTTTDAHPEWKAIQHKHGPSFENELLLFGNDRGMCKDAETIKERRIGLEREREESNSIDSNQEGDDGMEHEDEGDSIVVPSILKRRDPKLTSTSSKVAYKMKHVATSSRSEVLQTLKNGMDLVASAISKSAPRVYTGEELFEELSKVEGLDEDALLLVYDYLCGAASRGKTFMGLPISWRKRWIELKFGLFSHNRGIDSTRYDGLHHGCSYLEHLDFLHAVKAQGNGRVPAADLNNGSVAMGVVSIKIPTADNGMSCL